MRNDSINKSLHANINKKYQEQNRIYSIVFEVTHRCPCNCVHCFLLKKPKDELSIDEVKDLFFQLAKEGTIELALSGGEPFIREDFPKILSIAHEHRFFINILTTGILIGKKEVLLLQKYNIKRIEFSLLGAGPETHDSLMNFKGAFKRLMRVIKLLKENNMIITLKSTIMQQNAEELGAMQQLAKKNDVYFSSSLLLTPREDKNTAPQKFGLDIHQIKQLNFDLIDFAPLHSNKSLKGANLLCRAGGTHAGISPEGDIFPCILMRHTIGNIRKQSLEDIWHLDPDPFLKEFRSLEEKDISQCMNCTLRQICARCPGTAYMETGSLTQPSPIACFQAQAIQKSFRLIKPQ